MAADNNDSLNLRISLNKFRDKYLSAKELAEQHPNCECEKAYSEEGSQGPILDHEEIRLFLTSRNFKIKNISDLSVNRVRDLFKDNVISKVLKAEFLYAE